MPTARINHNTHLKDIHRSLAVHAADTSRQIGMLSSGQRVNRASDNAASLALADGIRSEVQAFAEGMRNIQQTFSLIQVADASLNEIADMVVRMRSLAMQAASSVFNDADRLSINSEFNELREEVDRIAGSTTYNGRHLLTGGNRLLDPASTALTAAQTTGIADLRVGDASGGTYTFVDAPGDGLITLGNGVLSQTVNIADRLLTGAVPAGEHFPVRFDRLGIQVTLTGAGVTGPGSYADGALDGQTLIVDEAKDLTFQVGPAETSNDVTRVGVSDMRATGPHLNLRDVSIVSRQDAQRALDRLAEVIEKVTAERNRLGAFQNRLELSIATSQSVMERLLAAESQIREVDVARSTTQLARSQVLTQAATSIAIESQAQIDRILALLQ